MINPTHPDYSTTPVSSRVSGYRYAPLNLDQVRPVVSIITPFFNTGKVFYETAASVFGQSFQQFEWLLIDDGSSEEEALDILVEFEHRDPRVRVIRHGENRGLSAARNTGFQEARTEFIVQLDSDDLLEPTALEKWLWFLKSYPACSFVKGYTVGFGAQEYIWAHGFEDRNLFLTENPVDATALIRKTTHQQVGGYEEGIRGGLEDWDFWLKCASQGLWGATIPEYLDWYRIRAVHRERWGNWNQEKIEQFLANARQKYPALWKEGLPAVAIDPLAGDDSFSISVPFHNPLSKEKRRVLFILPWLRMGGADKFNLDLLKQLSERGWEVTIVTTLQGKHDWAPEFEKYSQDVFVLDHFLRVQDYPAFLEYLVKSRQFDLGFVSNSLFGYQILPYLKYRFPRLPWVCLSHMEEEDGTFGAYPALSLEYKDYLDLYIVVSEHLRQRMIERGAPPDRVEVAYINVDPENWSGSAHVREVARSELNVPADVPLIVYVARICRQKQPRVFAKSLKALLDHGTEFRAVVIGDGPDRGMLERLIAELGLQKQVRLLGALPSSQVQRIYAAADIFFLPSEWEGIALTIYEAMAAGLPIVGAQVGGQVELVTEDSGILIRRSDEDSEANEYAQILAHLAGDPAMRQQMGQNGRQRVTEHFHIRQMGDRMETLFQRMIDASPEHPSREIAMEEAREHVARAVRQLQVNPSWQEPTTAELAAGQIDQHLDPTMPRHPVYLGVKSLLLPIYLWGIRRNWRWLILMKELFKKLFRKPANLAIETASREDLVRMLRFNSEQAAFWQARAEEYQRGYEWAEDQRQRWEKAAADLKAGNEWLEQQRASWQQSAENALQENEKLRAELVYREDVPGRP